MQDKQVKSKKNKKTLFYRKSSEDDLPLKFPALKIAHNKIERKIAIKFLRAILDENISW